MDQRIGFLVCENLIKEVTAVLAQEGFAGEVETVVFASHCTSSDKWQLSFDDALQVISDRCERFCIIRCSCPYTVVVPETLKDRVIPIREGAELFLPAPQFDRFIREGSYFITPGMLKNFNDETCRNYGRVIAEDKKSSVQRFVVLDSGLHPENSNLVSELSRYSSHPVEVVFVGLDFLRLYLSDLIYSVLVDDCREKSRQCNAELQKNQADLLMTYDLIGSIVQLKREEDVIASILELFTMLFSPESVSYASYEQGTLTGVVSRPPERSACDFSSSSPQALISQGDLVCENGFLFQISYDNSLLGLVVIQNIAFPKYREKYRDTSQFVLRVCGLAVSNARLYSTLNTTIEERDAEILLRKQAENGLQEANTKLNLLSSITRHDIINQIMVANIYLDMAIEDASDPFLEHLKTIHSAVEKIQRQIEFTRDYQDLGINVPEWQNPLPLIDACFKEQRDLKRGDGVTFLVELSPVEIYGDTMLGKVFCNLISNAFNHAEGMTSLTVSGKPEGSQYHIVIEDNGSGVSEDKKDLIFKAGFGRNHGYGLFLVREILGITNITITENGIPGEGARFELVVSEGGWRVPEEK